ncbi:MAG: P1 family peptidase [Bryobacterales bacterium]|nr:P1 family peptidase [Bryobacterales bacterium]
MKGLTDIPGIRVGHASDLDAITGCTVILCAGGAVAGYDLRGGASGAQELDVLSPLHIAGRVHAIVLSGGSAFGLEAASGVRKFLEQQGVGFETGAARVPIVPSAILYDLGIGKANVRPTREMGEAAAAAATAGAVEEGSAGAGTGATAGKIFGMPRAMKSGVGTFTVELDGGVLVSALVAANPLGDVIDPATGKIIAGARKAPGSQEFAGTAAAMKAGVSGGLISNTTLVVVATNALLSKVEATKLAQLSQLGAARTISPVWTMMDGDIAFALSLGREKARVDALGVAAAEAVSQAILRAVKKAKTLGGVPGLAG